MPMIVPPATGPGAMYSAPAPSRSVAEYERALRPGRAPAPFVPFAGSVSAREPTRGELGADPESVIVPYDRTVPDAEASLDCASSSFRNSIIMANGTQHAIAQQMPTSAIMTVACHTVRITNVDIISTKKSTSANVHTLRSMKGTARQLRYGLFTSWDSLRGSFSGRP